VTKSAQWLKPKQESKQGNPFDREIIHAQHYGARGDADDNVLAGAVRVGDAFPTGHLHAPAYPGCRCRVIATE
jgi:hypothetical protein